MSVNPGMIAEYYEVVKEALKIDLDREPTYTEIMEVVMNIVNRHLGREK